MGKAAGRRLFFAPIQSAHLPGRTKRIRKAHENRPGGVELMQGENHLLTS